MVKCPGCCTDVVGSIPGPNTCDRQRLGQELHWWHYSQKFVGLVCPASLPDSTEKPYSSSCPKRCLSQVSGPGIEPTTSVQQPWHFTPTLPRQTKFQWGIGLMSCSLRYCHHHASHNHYLSFCGSVGHSLKVSVLWE